MEWSRETSWRQGYLLGDAAIDSLGLRSHEVDEQALVIVATHDCDLAQHPSKEPLIEVLIGRVTTKDGNCTHAKSARKLHVEFQGEPAFWGEFEATAKCSVDKWALAQYEPRLDARLSIESQAIFQQWLASRYRRSAFPDEFEQRLFKTKLAEKISNAVKSSGELILGVFFDVDGGEELKRNGPEDTYTLDIMILHSADNFEAAEQAANRAAEVISKAFNDKLFDSKIGVWQQIELRFCEAVSETVLTYSEFKQLKRWRLDHISLAAEPQQPIQTE